MGLNIRVIAPDGLVWQQPALEIILPSTTGQIGILDGHAPLITALEIGILRIKVEQKWKPLLILGGFATIKNDVVTVLVSGIEEVIKGNYDEAQSLLNNATEGLSLAKTIKEKLEASQKLKRAAARLEAYQFLD
jgi:F-type H+-transporting ATPase subunit epsilon